MRVMNRRALRAFLMLGGLLGGLPVVTAAQTGGVRGRVTDQAAGQPIAGARVTVIGTALAALTNAEGRYVLRDVPAGPATVRVSYIGYAAASRPVTIPPGETAELDVVLALSAFSLDEVVVTATGDQAKREVGNAIAKIDAAKLVETAPITNLTDLLVAKAPGMDLLVGTLTGAPTRVRIRGTNSLSLSNEPVYVVDGVRIISANRSSLTCDVGCAPSSRVNDLNPDEIESVEVVKGPSAAALYGTDAANGVIVIKTKRGLPGPARWSLYAEQGFIKDYNDYPIAYRGWRTGLTSGTTSTPTNGVQCRLTQVAATPRVCVQDSVSQYNLFKDPESSPNATGYRQQYGLQVSGGSDAVRYFVSGDWENETGYLKMPPFAVERLLPTRFITRQDQIPGEHVRPNALRKTSVRVNLQANATPSIDFSASTGFISSRLRVPQTDNNTTGLLSNGVGGPGNKTNGLNGYRAFTPDEIFSETVTQDINRFIGSGTANWRPRSWLAARITGGIDFTYRIDRDLCRRGECVNFGTRKDGRKEDDRTSFFQYTGDASVAATFNMTPTLVSRTTAGVQYFKNLVDLNAAFAENIPGGATTVTPGVILDAAESTTVSKTLGAYVEQHFGYKDRLFVTGALRADDNSAFGLNFRAVYYPKLSISYVISEESFFPKWSWINSVRLRGAIGASGVQPGTIDALRFFEPRPASVDNEDDVALVFSALGNPNLKPERAREYEIGGDATLFGSRVNVELTYYNKRTKDALIARTLPPSGGASPTRFENLGAVVNRGIEGTASARLVDRPQLGWELTVSAAYNTNFIADMGDVPPIIGATTRQVAGYPINGWWQRPYTFADANGDGIIVASEIQVADSAAFVGYPNPRWEVTYNTAFDFFNRRLRITGLFDHKSGYYQLNGTERIRCESRNNCRGLIDPKAPLWEQARVVALRETPSRTQWGFFEKAGFIRLREASATYELPSEWARAFRASRLSLTVSGRNLWKTTSWTGMDPEANYFEGATGVVSNFQTAPPPTYWIFRLNVGF